MMKPVVFDYFSAMYRYILFLHIVSGGSSLLSGLIALSAKKGCRLHRLSGRVYLIAMTLVVFSSLTMSVIKPNPFLFSIGAFTLYMMLTGWRSVLNKSFIASWYDWASCGAAMITGAWMIAQVQIVLLVFGCILCLMGLQDFLLYYRAANRKPHKTYWLQTHIGRMTGSYIATTTAFLVVNIQLTPMWIIWLGPTLLGTILIIYYTKKYRSAFR